MTTVTISPYDADSWARAREWYTHGACASLAYEIHRLTGLPMAVLFQAGCTVEDHGAGHAFVALGGDLYLDIEGVHTRPSMLQRWEEMISGRHGDGIEIAHLLDDQAEDIYRAYGDNGLYEQAGMDEWWARRLLNEVGIEARIAA